MNKICYQCGAPATTREHVPPRSLFPKHLRQNLLTVPSCREHNQGNSEDVEYFRNIVTMHASNNSAGIEHGLDKTMRSFENSPGLLADTFANREPAVYRGQPTLRVEFDQRRFLRVLTAVCFALYYHDFKRVHPSQWHIVLDGDIESVRDNSGKQREMALVREMRKMPLESIPTDNPEIFNYSRFMLAERVLYKLVFYENFTIWGLSLPLKENSGQAGNHGRQDL